VLKRHAILSDKPARRANGRVPDLERLAGQPKTIQHYLLLPTFEWGVSEWHWNAALAFVKMHRPACGFSVEEAGLAQRVTIFGNEQGVSPEVEMALRRAGCRVERLQVTGGKKERDQAVNG